jgi:Flp pilus assembly protein TadG
MAEETNSRELGQNLIIIAILMVVMVALAGLVIDGGFSLLRRREAQNAADAGALAGVDVLCRGGTADAATAQAVDYAVTKNKAQSAAVAIGNREITVTTTIPHPTFFMRLFGSNVVTTTATASAGCYTPCSATVLPVAWSCQPPEVGGTTTITDTCGIDWGSIAEGHGPLYVIMDSNKIAEDIYCQDPPATPAACLVPPATRTPGTMDCNLNTDCVNELFAGGNRSWLNLSGGSGNANELRDWINGINVPELHINYWYDGSSGNKEAAYQAAGDHIGDIVMIPVYDRFCTLGSPEENCPSLYEPGDQTVYGSPELIYYRIIAFSAFRITCVVAPGVSSHCDHPARDQAIESLVNQGVLNNGNSVSTIEGYFVSDYVGEGKCEGPDTGAYTIYLNH